MSRRSLDLEQMVEKARSFHGHMCPGLALGIRASEIALREIGPHAGDEEVAAVVETDMCAIDAIQALLGCTAGKGNLIQKDYGKKAFSFYRRSDGKAIRIVALPSVFSSTDLERDRLRRKVQEGASTQEDRDRFAELQRALIDEMLDAPLESLFEIKDALPKIPEKARIHRSVICQACGEAVMETRIREIDGKLLCIPCSEI